MKDGSGNKRQKSSPWNFNRMSLKSGSYLDVLMACLTKPRNAERLRRENPTVLGCMISKALEKNGISHRELGDIRNKIEIMEKDFAIAFAYLKLKGQSNAFLRGEAGPGSRCGDKSNETVVLGPATIAATGRSKSVPGKWKESLEIDRYDVDACKKIQDASCEKVAEQALNGISAEQQNDIGDGDRKVDIEKKQIDSVDTDDVDVVINVLHEIASAAMEDDGQYAVAAAAEKHQAKDMAVVVVKDKCSNSNGKSDIGKARQQSLPAGKEAEVYIGIDVENDEYKQIIDDGDGIAHDKEAAQAVSASGIDSFGEKEGLLETVNVYPKVNRILKVKQQLIEPTASSDEEEESDEEEAKVREEEQGDDDDDDRDGQIQLAQPDDDREGEEDEDEIAELIEVDEDEDVITESLDVDEEDIMEDEVNEKGKTELEEIEAIDEEGADEETKWCGSKLEKLESSSSESEGGDNEEEVPPTQLKAASDVDEVSDNDCKHDVDNQDSGFDKEDPHQSGDERKPAWKRRSSDDSCSLNTKRARKSSNSTRDLERAVFIERAKQERDQRDEIYQLERAKLACELQSKQVQLAMEISLARKKLLSAGVDSVEVDRILPTSMNK
ncbi:unnamed protein product [Peronospora belbahrii]|uniref:Uncharacterized protein n=1 Tax=Peronospora belbahrii TaxID=622444 RepID=A0AAU9LT72_9STRA|nr:unnamed protein product [Peronospora belbahrii]